MTESEGEREDIDRKKLKGEKEIRRKRETERRENRLT